MPDEKKSDNFECRICGHTKYQPIHERIGPLVLGGHNTTKIKYYECAGCTIVFNDPSKFSKKTE